MLFYIPEILLLITALSLFEVTIKQPAIPGFFTNKKNVSAFKL